MPITPNLPWEADTAVRLCSVSWDSSYNSIVQFDDYASQTAYMDDLDSTAIYIEGLTLLKYDSMVKLPVPYATAINYNYLIVDIPAPNIPYQHASTAKTRYYYFIQDIKYIAPNTTALFLDIDYYQTYQFDYNLGYSYIERGHLGIAASLNDNVLASNVLMHRAMRKYLLMPEGLDTGSEFEASINKVIYNPVSESGFIIAFISTVDLSGDWGTLQNPTLKTGNGSYSDGIASGSDFYFCSPQSWLNLMSLLSDYPWIAQGLSHITVWPQSAMPDADNIQINGENIGLWQVRDSSNSDPDRVTLQTETIIQPWVNSRYSNLSKFYTAPYTYLNIFSYGKGNMQLSPQYILNFQPQTREGDFNYKVRHLSNPSIHRSIFNVMYYGSDQDYGYSEQDYTYHVSDNKIIAPLIDSGHYLQYEIELPNLPYFSAVNNMSLMGIAAQSGSIQYANQSADNALSRTYMGIRAQNDMLAVNQSGAVANNLINQASQQSQLRTSQSAEVANAQLDAIKNIGGGLIGGGGLAGGVGALAGVAAGIANTALDAAKLSNNQAAASTSLNIGQGADTQMLAYEQDAARKAQGVSNALAEKTASMDYQLAQASVNAAIQNTKTNSPATLGQVSGGNEYFYGHYAIFGRTAHVDRATEIRIGEFWLRYGYAINLYYDMSQLPNRLLTHSHASFWKMTECVVASGTMPEGAKDIIRGIFEKGTTVYADASYIGALDFAVNEPRGDILP